MTSSPPDAGGSVSGSWRQSPRIQIGSPPSFTLYRQGKGNGAFMLGSGLESGSERRARILPWSLLGNAFLRRRRERRRREDALLSFHLSYFSTCPLVSQIQLTITAPKGGRGSVLFLSKTRVAPVNLVQTYAYLARQLAVKMVSLRHAPASSRPGTCWQLAAPAGLSNCRQAPCPLTTEGAIWGNSKVGSH